MAYRSGNLFKYILAGIGLVIAVAALSLLSGTLIWLIWPLVVPVVFPGLVAQGMIAAALPWKISVGLAWLCSYMFAGAGASIRKS